jgi:hypothetical protein
MAWSVHTQQIRLAEQLARRQFIVTAASSDNGPEPPPGAETAEARAAVSKGAASKGAVPTGAASTGAASMGPAMGAASMGAAPKGAVPEARAANGGRPGRLTIEGPETVVAGEQARYRVRPAGGAQQVVTWAAGGGSVSQAPDPHHPDELLLVADEPGNLMVSVRVREGLTERRETKSVTAVPDVTEVAPPFTLRLFLQGWGLVVVAVLVIGFAGALDALGNLTSSDFIALVVPLAALLGVIAVARGAGVDVPTRPKTPHSAARRADPPG